VEAISYVFGLYDDDRLYIILEFKILHYRLKMSVKITEILIKNGIFLRLRCHNVVYFEVFVEIIANHLDKNPIFFHIQWLLKSRRNINKNITFVCIYGDDVKSTTQTAK